MEDSETAWNGCPQPVTGGDDGGQVVFSLFELAADPPLMYSPKKTRAKVIDCSLRGGPD